MQRSILPVSVLLLSGLAIYACGSDTLAPTESGIVPGPSGSVAVTSDGSGGETTDESPLARGKADKVDICHIPPGNPANAQLISISLNAEDVHVAKHGDARPGQGVPGSDPPTQFDANCAQIPLDNGATCPCDLSVENLVDGLGMSGGGMICSEDFLHWQPDALSDAGRVELTAFEGSDRTCAVLDFTGGGFDELIVGLTAAEYAACNSEVIATAGTVGAFCGTF